MNAESKTKSIVLCALFTALITVGAYIRIPIGTVSFTLQSLMVMLAAMLLGPAKSAVTAAVYAVLGLIGIPVFTSGGGIASLASPSFGFVIGFIPLAAVTGLIVKKFGAKLSALFAAAAAGTLALYIFGLAYGFFIMNVYLSRGMSIGVLIWTFVGKFVPADILKCVAAALLSAKLIPAVKKAL